MTPKRRRCAAWLQGDGIEIGALHNPMEVAEGTRVRYVDRLPVHELRHQYPELAGLPIVDVDLIGSAEDLNVIPTGSLDFVIANHLLEHLEDPIAGLVEFQRVLRPAGIVYLALPDQRQTFDRGRRLTSLAHLLDQHRTGAAADHRWDHYLEWARHVDRRGPDSEKHARTLMERGYSIHFHVWRADTFLDFFYAARREFDLDFELLDFARMESPEDLEFIVVLGRGRSETLRLPREPSAVHPFTGSWPDSGPAHAPTGWQRGLTAGPLGPPIRALRRLARRARRSAARPIQESSAG